MLVYAMCGRHTRKSWRARSAFYDNGFDLLSSVVLDAGLCPTQSVC